MIYTGVGSREAPSEMLAITADYTAVLAASGHTGRSGAADGMDTATEKGIDRVQGPKEIYLPWRGFNKNASPLFGVCEEALAIAATVHPAWHRLSDAAKLLHGRNVYQVLGKSLSAPSDFVLCWTPDGMEQERERTSKSGGTATAIVLADRRGIPVFNLGREGSMSRLNEFMAARGMDAPHKEKRTLKQAGLF